MKLINSFLLGFLFIINFVAQSQIFDVDGNEYDTVIIGHQIWFKESLKTTHFSNGDPIPNDTNNFIWSQLSTPSYCNFGNDSSWVLDYGRLYNWFVVSDPRNVCPEGWHVPTKGDWEILINELGGPDSVKGQLNEVGNSHWKYSTGGATNSSGFTALPSGMRYGPSFSNPGEFNAIQMLCSFWTSNFDPEYMETKAFSHYFYQDDGGTFFHSSFKQYGLSVRCIRNTLTSIDERAQIDVIKAIPNPTTGVFRLNIPENNGANYSVKLFTMQGNLVMEQSNDPIVDITKLPKQILIVRVSYSNKYFYTKLILR